jgi:hypothetical protein
VSQGAAPPSRVDLYWLPLGADDRTHLVTLGGGIFERWSARRQGRTPVPLFHAALRVDAAGASYAVEMAPAWQPGRADRDVVGEGPVGATWLGRSRLFRYEVRRGRGGSIPDVAHAVDSPRPVATDPVRAGRLLHALPDFPRLTWGRDEQQLGEMWNSNSMVAWLLARSGHDTAALRPPRGGRAPGWDAGLAAVAREEVAR